jgi:hypothetical protein
MEHRRGDHEDDEQNKHHVDQRVMLISDRMESSSCRTAARAEEGHQVKLRSVRLRNSRVKSSIWWRRFLKRRQEVVGDQRRNRRAGGGVDQRLGDQVPGDERGGAGASMSSKGA